MASGNGSLINAGNGVRGSGCDCRLPAPRSPHPEPRF
jgi:hypothetical protein